MHVEAKDGSGVTEEQWNFCSLKAGTYLTEPLHLGEGVRVDNFCRPDGDGEVALTVETDSGSCLGIGLMGDSWHNYGTVLELPIDENSPILVQEAFEAGRVRHSEFVSWWLPIETNMESDLVMEELVRSEERNTLTGSMEGLILDCLYLIIDP